MSICLSVYLLVRGKSVKHNSFSRCPEIFKDKYLFRPKFGLDKNSCRSFGFSKNKVRTRCVDIFLILYVPSVRKSSFLKHQPMTWIRAINNESQIMISDPSCCQHKICILVPCVRCQMPGPATILKSGQIKQQCLFLPLTGRKRAQGDTSFQNLMNYDETSDRGPCPAQMLQNTVEVYGCIRSCNIVTTNTGES